MIPPETIVELETKKKKKKKKGGRKLKKNGKVRNFLL